MQPVAIVAVGAVSPFGRGPSAYAVGGVGAAPETRVAHDAALARAGLARPVVARAPLDDGGTDRAQALLAAAAETLVRDLDQKLPDWRARRILLCVGSSAGGMATVERALERRARSVELDAATARGMLYDGPLSALRTWFDAPVVQVLAACASSTVAIGLGARWLDAELADLVIAGGYDALTNFVATGFEALGATTASGLAPFRLARDGMALGEGAALVALVRANVATGAFGHVLGFSLTNDAAHVTAPDPAGRGLARAALQALADAAIEPDDIELVSAHATATLHNDRAEARAIAQVLGGAPSSAVVHPFKASIGHCLGAAGALETLAALSAMQSSVLPGALGKGPIEPDFPLRLLETNEAGSARTCLKLSAGFGGSNAALIVAPIVGSGSWSVRPRRTARVLALGEFVAEPALDTLVPLSVVEEARLARLSLGGALAATALASALRDRAPLPRDRVGVIVGTSLACLEENERFDQVRRDRGPRAVEPRRFSRTSPNLAAGECSIAFGFTGPGFSVGGGPRAPIEALAVGSDLVAAGDADYIVVISYEEVGPVTRELCSAATLPVPRHGARAVLLGVESTGGLPIDRAELARMLTEPAPVEAGGTLLALGVSRATGTARPAN